jgi:hypothetical protein
MLDAVPRPDSYRLAARSCEMCAARRRAGEIRAEVTRRPEDADR